MAAPNLNWNFTFHGSCSKHRHNASRSLLQTWFSQMKHAVHGAFHLLSGFIICSRLQDVFWVICQSQTHSGAPERSWKIITTQGDRLTSFVVGTLTIRRGISLPLQSFKASSFSRLCSSSGTSDVVRLTDFLLVRLALLPRPWAYFRKSKIRGHFNRVSVYSAMRYHDRRPQV